MAIMMGMVVMVFIKLPIINNFKQGWYTTDIIHLILYNSSKTMFSPKNDMSFEQIN